MLFFFFFFFFFFFCRDRLAIEIATQLKAFVTAFGRAPDFIDGHQHVQLFPQVREPLLEMVKDIAPRAWVRQCGRLPQAKRRLADKKALLLDALSREFGAQAEALGIRTNPAFAGAYDFTQVRPAGFRPALSGFPARPAAAERGDVPSGLCRCRAASGSIRSPGSASTNMPIWPARLFLTCCAGTAWRSPENRKAA